MTAPNPPLAVTDALKPCPFCGVAAASERAASGGLHVFCPSCGSAAIFASTHEAAIAIWNTRASPSTPSNTQGALEVAAIRDEDIGALRYVLNWADSNSRIKTIMRAFTLPDRLTTQDKLERLYAALAVIKSGEAGHGVR